MTILTLINIGRRGFMYKYSLLLLASMSLFAADFSSKEKVLKVATSEFKKAVNLYRHKQYEEALAGFDRVLIGDEDDINAKIYYAMTLYKLGIYDEAKKEIEMLLKLDLSQQQKTHLAKLLEAVEEKTKRHFFNATLSLGVGYDDNIDLTTDARTTKYGGLTLINDTNKSDSVHGLASLSLSHRYHGDSFDVVSSLYSYNEFAHSHDGNDMNFLNLSTGILKELDKWSFMLPVGVNAAYLDGDAVAYNIYTNPTISYKVNSGVKTYMQVSYLDNTTKFSTGRDYTMLGANVGLVYAKSSFSTGFQVGFIDVNQKEDLRFDVEKDVLSASVFGKYFIYSKSFIAANVAYMQDKYIKLDRAMGYKREDDSLSAKLSLGRKIGQNALVELGYLYRKNDSNVNAYTYDKNIYTVEYKYKF